MHFVFLGFCALHLSLLSKLNSFFSLALGSQLENCKIPGDLPQTPLDELTAFSMAKHDFHFVKIINALFGLCLAED